MVGPKIISGGGKSRTELEKFARTFHQDWDLCFPSFREGALEYFQLSDFTQNHILLRELKAFVAQGGTESQLLQRWHMLGAQAWQRGMPVREGFEQFIADLQNYLTSP